MERIPAATFRDYPDHTARYSYAARHIRQGETVNDIACGTGYGVTILPPCEYRGFDKPGIPDAERFGAACFAVDLDDPSWDPPDADVTVCFETLEHVLHPARLADVIARTTRRAVFVSVPTYPCEENPFHLHDFTLAEVPGMFPGFTVADEWPQPEGRSHIWRLERTGRG